jgi:DNA-binding protein Fis
MIASALECTGGNRTQAAEILGISREGLRIKMQRFAANHDSSGHHSSK